MSIKVYCCILVAMLAAVSCGAEQNAKTSVKKVKCEVVESRAIESTQSSFSGRVVPDKSVNLSFRIAGVVDRVVVKEGDFVRKDQVVVELDHRDYELQLAATEAEYSAIKGEVDRIVQLYEQKSVSDNDYEKAVGGLRQITAKLESHRNALADTQLKAPFDGYVQRINFDRGEALSAGMPVMSFISAGAPRVSIDITAQDYMRYELLQSATATLQSYPGETFTLRGVGVEKRANLNQLFKAHFTIESSNGRYPAAGTIAMVSLKFEGEQSEITIPAAALVERGGKCAVWLIVNGAAQLQEVVAGGVTSCGRVVIESGVVEEDVVITAGVSLLKDGMSVEPLAEPSKSNVGNIR